MYHIKKSRLHLGKKLLLEAIEIRKDIGDSIGISQTYSNLASIANNAGDTRGAINMLFESMKISVALNDSEAIGHNKHNLGQLYRAMGYVKAIFKQV